MIDGLTIKRYKILVVNHRQQNRSISRIQNRSIIRTTRIIKDHRKSLRKNNRVYKWNVDKTSKYTEQTGRIAKEHGLRSRIVWQRQNKIWRLVERNQIKSQK